MPLIIAIFTLASSCTSNTPPKKVSFTLRKATLRVDRSYLVSARQISHHRDGLRGIADWAFPALRRGQESASQTSAAALRS